MRVIFAALIIALQIPALAGDPLKLSFVSENKQVVPGKTFSIGLHQKLKPGYHSYWKNPGTVGLPMSVEWKLPRGFKAGEIQWPTPEIAQMAVYDVWGYHNEAFLMVDIQAPADLKTGTKVTLEGTAIWMCCGKSCFPGNQRISLTLPVADRAEPDDRWTAHFAKTRLEQPVNSKLWQIQCRASRDRYQLTISPADTAGRRLPKNIRFFEYDRQISSEKGQRVKRKKNQAIVSMRAEEHTGEELSRLRGILVADSEWQAGRKVIAVDAPITRK